MSNVVIVEAERPTVEEASAREILDVTQTRAFNAVMEKLDSMIESERHVLESADTLREIRRAQGAIKALRTARGLPAILVREREQAFQKRVETKHG